LRASVCLAVVRRSLDVALHQVVVLLRVCLSLAGIVVLLSPSHGAPIRLCVFKLFVRVFCRSLMPQARALSLCCFFFPFKHLRSSLWIEDRALRGGLRSLSCLTPRSSVLLSIHAVVSVLPDWQWFSSRWSERSMLAASPLSFGLLSCLGCGHFSCSPPPLVCLVQGPFQKPFRIPQTLPVVVVT